MQRDVWHLNSPSASAYLHLVGAKLSDMNAKIPILKIPAQSSPCLPFWSYVTQPLNSHSLGSNLIIFRIRCAPSDNRNFTLAVNLTKTFFLEP